MNSFRIIEININLVRINFMKIIICGSMTISKSMIIMEEELLKRGHTVVLPKFTRNYA